MIRGNPESSSGGRIAALVAIGAVFSLIFAVYSANTIRDVKIDGGHFKRVVQGKDLMADILPPPSNLVETYLTAMEMVGDPDGSELPALTERFYRLKGEYRARRDFWMRNLPDGELKRAFLDHSYVPGMRMLETVETGLLPALQAGDRAKAEELLRGPIRKDYEEHRFNIDKVVEMAARRIREQATTKGPGAGRQGGLSARREKQV